MSHKRFGIRTDKEMNKVNKYEVVVLEDTVSCLKHVSNKWFKLTGFCAGVSYADKVPVFKFYLGDIGTPENQKKAKYVTANVGQHISMYGNGIFIVSCAIVNVASEN